MLHMIEHVFVEHAVGSLERLDAAMARERDLSSEYLHEVSR